MFKILKVSFECRIAIGRFENTVSKIGLMKGKIIEHNLLG